jgi:hypothetical protein
VKNPYIKTNTQNLLRKGLHQLLPVPSGVNLFPQRVTPIAPSSFLCQSVSAKTYTRCSQFHIVPICFHKLMLPACANFFLLKAYTFVLSVPACANLVSASLHHEGFLRVPICFCKYHIQFSFSIRLNVTSTCATLQQQALYLSDIGTCMHGRTCVHCAPT